jgi:hypothetical protein
MASLKELLSKAEDIADQVIGNLYTIKLWTCYYVRHIQTVMLTEEEKTCSHVIRPTFKFK